MISDNPKFHLPEYFTDEELRNQIQQNGIRKYFPRDSIIMNPGDAIEYMPIVLAGAIRVMIQNSEGQERYLYHIHPGESCAMSLTCCQSMRRSEIHAITEEETEVLFIPVQFVETWSCYHQWKKYLSETQAQRFSELLETIELLAFSNLDEQIWSYLMQRAQAHGSNMLKITHQEIALEINTPREVVTRLLHQLKQRGKIEMSRGLIKIFITQ
jgi:CRP/FNR family transcriptional regulator